MPTRVLAVLLKLFIWILYLLQVYAPGERIINYNLLSKEEQNKMKISETMLLESTTITTETTTIQAWRQGLGLSDPSEAAAQNAAGGG